MKRIKWHEVTWYSKWGTVVLFLVVVPILGIIIHRSYVELQGIQALVASETGTPGTPTNTSPTSGGKVAVPEDWLSYINEESGFRVSYGPAWKKLAMDSGVAFDLPIDIYGTSTVQEVRFSVQVVPETCKVPDTSNHHDVVGMNGIDFTHSTGGDAAMMHRYANESYSVERDDSCYTISYDSSVVNPDAYVNTDKTGANNDTVLAATSRDFSTFVHSFAFLASQVGSREDTVELKSVSPLSASVGKNVTLSGSLFSGHDTLVWMYPEAEGSPGKFVLWGGMPSSDSSMDITIPATACRQYTGASGLPCTSSATITAGHYFVYVQNQNGISKPLPIIIK
jgi:hypothetical protein